MILLQLLYSFFKIGAFTFGGGYAMIPLIEREIISIRGWLSLEEFIDIVAVAEMTPGPIAINSATYVGYKVGGVLGSAAATFGVVLPSFLIIVALASLYLRYRENPAVGGVTAGLKPGVVGLIVAAAVSIGKETIIDWRGIVIGAGVLIAVKTFKVHPILAIVASAAIGILVYG